MLGWLRRTIADLSSGPEEFGRSGAWARVRREHLEREPACVACGRSKDLEVHHIQPYHLAPELELEQDNLVTLCADPCHLVFGHLLSWRRSNPDVRHDASVYRKKVSHAQEAPDVPGSQARHSA